MRIDWFFVHYRSLSAACRLWRPSTVLLHLLLGLRPCVVFVAHTPGVRGSRMEPNYGSGFHNPTWSGITVVTIAIVPIRTWWDSCTGYGWLKYQFAFRYMGCSLKGLVHEVGTRWYRSGRMKRVKMKNKRTTKGNLSCAYLHWTRITLWS